MRRRAAGRAGRRPPAPAARPPGDSAVCLVLALTCATTFLAGEVPHRELSTQRFFPDRPGLNHQLAAFFPDGAQLEQLLRLSRIFEEEAARQGLDPAQASPEFFERLIQHLYDDKRDLLAAVPSLAHQAAHEGLDDDLRVEIDRIRKLAEALRGSPLLEPLERFMISAALRAQDEKRSDAFRHALGRLRDLLENAGASRAHLAQVHALLKDAAAHGRHAAAQVHAFWRQPVARVGELAVPPFVLPLAVVACAAGALAAVLLMRSRARTAPPPALPDFSRLAPDADAFSGALLALYQRFAFEDGAPFTGMPISDLARTAARRRERLARAAPVLNRAFHEIWYGGTRKSPAELHALATLLADAAGEVRPGRRT